VGIMNRPWKVWVVFGLSFAVLLTAMGWVSRTTLRLDRAQAQAAQKAELEEKVRLALWRMDSSLTPLILEESARPYSAYSAFHSADRAYTKGGAPVKEGEVLIPSPLLNLASSNILLHFQFWPDGTLTSPQVPAAMHRSLAESVPTASGQIAMAAAQLGRLQNVLRAQAPPQAAATISSAATASRPAPVLLSNGDLLINQCAVFRTNTVEQISIPALTQFNPARQSELGQMFMNNAEFNARANVYQQVQEQALANNLANNIIFPSNTIPLGGPNPSDGPLKPLWLGDELLLARRANLAGRFVVQGCWLNWPNVKQSLLASIQDLFPLAELQPSTDPNDGPQARLLAALPVKLVSGGIEPGLAQASRPVRLSIAVAWLCVLLAGVAVAVLLHGTVSLSERRGAFVSAVTHELRTPLTTFKMYSEMLAEGMVPEEAKRKQYLDTLCSEANRLGHLVENVLAYARLERGSARSGVQKVTLGELIARIKPSLLQRAERASMALVEDSSPEALKTVVHVDLSAVEQILFNLVDNACKYAAPSATERVIHLEALPDGKFAMLRIRDHGQGISAEGAKRLFKPFSKSAHEAAHSAPGVGLGLALCRRLSRSMGGDLRLDTSVKSGTCFELRLPIGARDQAAAI
jgi:signal transduction histidine kinase